MAGSIDYASSATKTFFVGLLVGIAHLVLGICVVAQPLALDVTALAALRNMIGTIPAGWLLIGVGLAAIVGASDWLWLSHRMRVTCFVPQQLVLLSQLWSIGEALALGHYPDGYIPLGGAWFILADQVQAWILAVSHSIWMAAIVYGGLGGGLRKDH